MASGGRGGHGTLRGPATQKILEREFRDYRDVRYQRLASISVAHIYNLRRRRNVWAGRRISYPPTQPTPVSKGQRRAPQPEGRPG